MGPKGPLMTLWLTSLKKEVLLCKCDSKGLLDVIIQG